MSKFGAGLAAAFCTFAVLVPTLADAQGRHERGGNPQQAAPAAPRAPAQQFNRGGNSPRFQAPRQFGGGGGGPARFAAPPQAQLQRALPQPQVQRFVQPQIQRFVRPQPAARSIVVRRAPERFQAGPAFRGRVSFEGRRFGNRVERGRVFRADSARVTRRLETHSGSRVQLRTERRLSANRVSGSRAATREERYSRRLGAALPQRADGVRSSSRRLGNDRRDPAIASGNRNSGRVAAARAARPFFARTAARNQPDGRRVHRRGRGHFVAFIGPVFWPYASADIFDYAFLPTTYDDGFWEDAYDDIFVGVFEPGAGFVEPSTASIGANAPIGTTASAPRDNATPSREGGTSPVAARTEICNQAAPGLTDFPFARIAETVQPDDSQRAALDALKTAADKAADSLRLACPSSVAQTPPQRLSATKARLVAMREAVRSVQPALEAFYAGLSDEQKARFNAMTPNGTSADTAQALANAKPDADACKSEKSGLSAWPTDRLDRSLDLTRAQETKLEALRSATQQAVVALQTACPDYTPLTPTGRLDAAAQRLDAMITAIDAVAPALDGFYASLSDNQKARYGRLGQQASQE